jgi:hypothetical protein
LKPRFIAGPPGTGKTHGFIVGLYKDLLPKYHPDKIKIRGLNWKNTNKLETNWNGDYISYHYYMR